MYSMPAYFIGGGWDWKSRVKYTTHANAGSGDFGAEPNPVPWFVATMSIVSAVGLSQVAQHMSPGAAKTELAKSSAGAIDALVDEVCGTPVPGHWPWPPPTGPLAPGVVMELGVIAQSCDGGMRDGLLSVASKIAQKSFELSGVRTSTKQ